MAGIIETLLKETFGVATAPENSGNNPHSIKNVLVQETFGIATQPEAQTTPITLLVGAALLEEAGFLSPLKQTAIATQPEVGTSATLEVIRQVAEKSWLETVATATAFATQDIAKGAFQATEPEGPTPTAVVWAWSKNKVGQTFANIKNRRAAANNAKAQAAAEAEETRKQQAAVDFQNQMNQARRDAAQAERDYADAKERSAAEEANSAKSAVVTAESLQNIKDILDSLRNWDAPSSNSNQGKPDIIDGNFTE